MKCFLFFIFFVFLLAGCKDQKMAHKGILQSTLFPCSETSHSCKSSVNPAQGKWYVEPIKYVEPTEVAREKLSKIILKNHEARIIKLNPSYITATYKTSLYIMEIYDDAEFLLMPERQEIHMRIESRSSLPDFGRIHRLIEEIRFKFFQNDVN